MATDILDICSVEELRQRGRIVVTEGRVPIVVFCHEGGIHAVDNRCPHMGFPLHRGTIKDGILTCHWHHARFELKSGCTFDLFADDVNSYPLEVRDGRVYLQTVVTGRDPVEHGMRRLHEGMDLNIRLVIAKAVVALIHANAETTEIVTRGALYGVRRRRGGWSNGLTILTAMANVVDHLEGQDRIAPLYQGLVEVASDCAGQPPTIMLRPLESADITLPALTSWFRDLVEVRNQDGAKRCLLTAVRLGATDSQLAEMMLTAATDHYYLSGGHVVDFINKAFEALDRIGWQHAGELLTALVAQLSSAQRSEESNAWRSPVDLVTLLKDAFASTAELLKAGEGLSWQRDQDFIDLLLSDDANAIVTGLNRAVSAGARPVQLAQSVAYAAALRVAKFHTQNEFSDWIGVLHTFTYANGLHQLLKRCEPRADLTRGVYHGAMRVYLDRFLNVPAARLPAPAASLNDAAKRKAASPLTRYLALLDQQQMVDEAGQLVYEYLENGGDSRSLFPVLAESLLREDAEFHSFQMLEAAIRQFGEMEGDADASVDVEARRLIATAAARYLAAHAPTQRERQQTLRIATRLHRGEPVYEDEDGP